MFTEGVSEQDRQVECGVCIFIWGCTVQEVQHNLDPWIEFMGANVTQMIMVVYRSRYWTPVRASVAGAGPSSTAGTGVILETWERAVKSLILIH